MSMSADWTSVRIRRSTLEKLKAREPDEKTHDEYLTELLDRRDE